MAEGGVTTTTYTETYTTQGPKTRLVESEVVVRSSSGAAVGAGSSPRPETNAQDETIEKLRLANQALRQQLKEFSRALDASLSQGVVSGGVTADSQGKRRNMHAALNAKEKQLKAVHKKLELYKRANVELKKQLGNVYQPEKLQQLKSEKRDKERIIEELQSENKSLLTVQRNQTKKIEEQENLKHEWPAKVSSLMADLRVAKEKLRKVKERETRVEQDSRKLHEQMVRLQEKNKKLQAQLAQYEKHSGKSAAQRAKKKMMHEWKDEKAKLERSIQVLERSKQQERTKGERLLRANMAELQKVKKEMERHKRQLDEKEKEIRLQVLQVKKLRRQLRELALGGGGSGAGSGPRSGWKGDGADNATGSSRSVSAIGSSGSANGAHHGPGAGGGVHAGDSRLGYGVVGKGHAPRGKIHHNNVHIPHYPKADYSNVKGTMNTHYGGKGKGKGHARHHSASKIQATFRGRKARRELAQQHKAATKVQKLYRGHSTKKLHRKKQHAATKLQSAFRGHRVRKTHNSKKRMSKKHAATKIQAHARGKLVRGRPAGGAWGGAGNYTAQDEEDAAVSMQALFRGHKGRRKYKNQRASKDRAVRTIQKAARGYTGRVQARRRRGEKERERARRFAAGASPKYLKQSGSVRGGILRSGSRRRPK